jgi:hypothetical protein
MGTPNSRIAATAFDPHSDRGGTKTAVERIRKQFEKTQFTLGTARLRRPPVSESQDFEVRKLPIGTPSWNELMPRFTQRRHKGRNRIEFEDLPEHISQDIVVSG